MAYEPSKTVGRVAFFAHMETIRDMLQKGHRNKEIFACLDAKLNMSYSQFNRYVSRYITGAKDDGHQRKGGEQIAQPSPSPASTGGPGGQTKATPAPVQKPGAKRPGFEHNPNSGNNDDLI